MKQWLLNELDRSKSKDTIVFRNASGVEFTAQQLADDPDNKIVYLPSGIRITASTQIENSQNQALNIQLHFKNPDDEKFFKDGKLPDITVNETGGKVTKTAFNFELVADYDDDLTAEGKTIEGFIIFRRAEVNPSAPDFKKVPVTIACNSPPPLIKLGVIKNNNGVYVLITADCSTEELKTIHRDITSITSTSSTDTNLNITVDTNGKLSWLGEDEKKGILTKPNDFVEAFTDVELTSAIELQGFNFDNALYYNSSGLEFELGFKDRQGLTSKAELISLKPKATSSSNRDFVRISAGKMDLGETGNYKVTITRPFEICTHEVTQAEYENFCKYSSSSPSDTYGVGNEFPAYYVAWYDAIVYCNLRSIDEKLEPCYKLGEETDPKKWSDVQKDNDTNPTKFCGPANKNTTWNGIKCDFTKTGYRLPTEAEWEIASRGGVEGDCYSGTSVESELVDYAWYKDNSGGKTHEAKTRKSNAYGLYDMSGNVWELCWDWYNRDIYSGEATDPVGADSGLYRVFRAGNWDSLVWFCSVYKRTNTTPSNRNYCLGFRLARSSF